MVSIDFSGKVVLITGGTKGIGFSTAKQFANAGAKLFLTYKWGSADVSEITSSLKDLGAPDVTLVQADVSVEEDTVSLLEEIAKAENGVDIFISNVGFASRTMDIDEYKKRSLFKTLEYSTWPLIDYTRKIHEKFSRYPSRIIGISSDGPDHFYSGYDFVAASKALLEFFSKYLSVHLFEEGTRVNVLRFGTVQTESFDQIFGKQFFDFLKKQGISETTILQPDQCGKAVLALCSDLMEAVNGQIISVDYGLPFQDNLMMRYLKEQTIREKP